MTATFDIVSRVHFKPEDVLPLELCREHTKTDDTPTVTDRQIEMYRDTAFEQAELYTGRIILGYASILQYFKIDASEERRPKRTRRLKLAYFPIERFVSVGGQKGSREQVLVEKNNRNIDVPNDCFTVDIGNCCSGNGLFYNAQTMYTTGYKNKEDIPSTILYGCLKFIAWSIGNPGDELMTVRNRLGTTETGLIGTNNASWASGAIEHWRGYKVR